MDAADDAAAQVANAGDQAPPVTKAQPPTMQEPPTISRPIDETPTEPATTPRQIDPEVREWPVELQLTTLEYGPRPEPEIYPCRYVMNDGQWTPEEHEAHLYKAGQAHHVHASMESSPCRGRKAESRIHSKHGGLESSCRRRRLHSTSSGNS